MIDIHNHSLFSFDSTEDPKNSLEKAISLDGKVFGISDHLNLYPYSELTKIIEHFSTYDEVMSELKEKYKGQIIFVHGLEFNYYKGQDDNYLLIEKNIKVDYIINSLHNVGPESFYTPDFFKHHDIEAATEEYLDDLICSLSAKYDWQVLGHFCQISKVYPSGDKNVYYKDHKEKFDYILKYLIEHNKSLEVNTNHDGVNVFPHESVLKRYFELGGRNVTLGGDAHKATNVYKNSQVGINILKRIGFTAISYYEDKVRKEIKI